LQRLPQNKLKQYTQEQKQAHICLVNMKTVQGKKFAAKVDVNGIQTTDELLRGLRAAFAHYTGEEAPAEGDRHVLSRATRRIACCLPTRRTCKLVVRSNDAVES
jgi:hypothetical protein